MIEIERTFDPELITAIMTQPDLWETVAEDGQTYSDFVPEMTGEIWLLVIYKGNLAGTYNLHAKNTATWEIHAQILAEYRKEVARESARAVLQWFMDYSPHECQKLIASVPVIYPNVISFTENAGFQREGVNRKSYWKGGELHDQVMLGITKPEIDSFLGGRQ